MCVALYVLLTGAKHPATGASEAQTRAHFKAGAYAAALASYSAGLAIDADSSVLYSNRSGAHASLANYAAALEDAERCVALRPEWAKGHTRMASALHGLARFRAAIVAFDAALGYEPGSQALLSGRRQSSFALAVEAD